MDLFPVSLYGDFDFVNVAVAFIETVSCYTGLNIQACSIVSDKWIFFWDKWKENLLSPLCKLKVINKKKKYSMSSHYLPLGYLAK